MREIISKELLGEVFGENVLSFSAKHNEIFIQFENYDAIINIHELKHQCKLKALSYGYEIVEYKDKIRIHHLDSINISSIASLDQNIINFEPYRVFKAFKYILDTRD